LAAWQAKGFPLEKGAADCTPAAFAVQPLPEMIATKADVLDALQSSDVILLDDRDEVEWAGLSSSPYGIDFAPRKGRIPGARWIEWYRFMHVSRPQPCFKSPDEIKGLCAEKSIFPEDDIIVYCFKGSRAANTFVALQQAGFDKVRVYFASWNEWSRCSELPIDDRMLAE
ncbi:MAG: sulfurtransferase, partial [bacterium]|nr:sulfurtransferase [bacterium]